MRFKPFSALFFALVLASCTNEMMAPVPVQGPFRTFAERPCPEESVLDYENFGEAFLLDWCVGCHSSYLPPGERGMAPEIVNLDRHDAIQLNTELIWLRAGDGNATMPPVGAPDEVERALFGEWLACGAP